MPFNFNRKTVFLTYAQCPLEPQAVYDALHAKHAISEYIVAREQHQDGHFHIHAFIVYTEPLHTRDVNYFNIATHHPNIATPNKKDAKERVKNYVKKGGNYITNMTILSKREALFEEILKEGLTKKLVIENPSVMALNFSSIKQWVNLVRGTDPPKFPEIELPKRRHLWMHGIANTGKTYYLRAMIRLYEKPCQIPLNNDWSFADLDVDCLYLDEFKGNLTIQNLNSICDGRLQCNTKGASTFICYPRVIIASNFTPEGAYHNASRIEVETLYRRFEVYDMSVRKPKFPTSEL